MCRFWCDYYFFLFFIIIIYPRIWAWLESKGLAAKKGLLRFLLQSVAVSSAAWLGAAGLVAYYFDIITPLSVLANIFVIPLITFIVVLGFGLLLCGLFLPFLSPAVAFCLKVVLNFLALGIYAFSRFRGMIIVTERIGIREVCLYYFILIVIFIVHETLKDGLGGRLTKIFNYAKVSTSH